jgi:toxin ParE1/3/4
MRRYAVLLRPEAREDLQSIFDGVLKVSQNRNVARNFVSRILQRCRRIGNVPHGGQPRDDLMAGMRTVPFEDSAVITYSLPTRWRLSTFFTEAGTTMLSIKKCIPKIEALTSNLRN